MCSARNSSRYGCSRVSRSSSATTSTCWPASSRACINSSMTARRSSSSRAASICTRPLGELPERRPAPQGKRRFEGIGCAGRVCPRERTGVDHTLLEIEAVERVTIDADAVTRAIALEQGSDRLAKLRDVALDGVSSRLGRIVPPQSVDDAVHRHDPVRLGQEAREHEPLLRPTERWLALGARSTAIVRTCARGRADRRADPHRPEHFEPHHSMVGGRREPARRDDGGDRALASVAHDEIVSEHDRSSVGKSESCLLSGMVDCSTILRSVSDAHLRP